MDLTVKKLNELCDQGKKVKQYHHTGHKGIIVQYYGFLKLLSKHMKPELIVEFGTWTGASAMYLADGSKESKVISLDNLSICEERGTEKEPALVNDYMRPNIEYKIMDAMDLVLPDESIDILFIDGYHDYNAVAEFEHFLPMMKNESVILMDDLNWSQGLKKGWLELKEKYDQFEFIERHDLHNWRWEDGPVGFGYVIIKKNQGISGDIKVCISNDQGETLKNKWKNNKFMHQVTDKRMKKEN